MKIITKFFDAPLKIQKISGLNKQNKLCGIRSGLESWTTRNLHSQNGKYKKTFSKGDDESDSHVGICGPYLSLIMAE